MFNVRIGIALILEPLKIIQTGVKDYLAKHQGVVVGLTANMIIETIKVFSTLLFSAQPMPNRTDIETSMFVGTGLNAFGPQLGCPEELGNHRGTKLPSLRQSPWVNVYTLELNEPIDLK